MNKPRPAFTDFITDPIRCPVTQSFDDCFATQVTHSQAGNPDLQPERSGQVNIGVVVEPATALSVGVELWRIDHRQRIVFADRYFIDNEEQFPDRIVRAPPSAEDIALGIPGPILELRDTYINLASQRLRGADFEISYRPPPFGWGRLTFSAEATYLDQYDVQIRPEDPSESRAGGDGHPRLKAAAALQWQRGPWQLRLDGRHIDSYRYENGRDEVQRRVASFTTFDASLSWRLPSGQLTFLVRNLADRDPPFRDALEGYDIRVHDPRGRLLSVTYRHQF